MAAAQECYSPTPIHTGRRGGAGTNLLSYPKNRTTPRCIEQEEPAKLVRGADEEANRLHVMDVEVEAEFVVLHGRVGSLAKYLRPLDVEYRILRPAKFDDSGDHAM